MSTVRHTFLPDTEVSTLTGARAVTASPFFVRITVERANFGQPWPKLAVQHPKWGSRPKIWASSLLELKGIFPWGSRVHSTWLVICTY